MADAQTTASPLMLSAQYLKDLSFESPNAPLIFSTPPTSEPRLEVAVNVASQPLGQGAAQPGRQAGMLYEVSLRIRTQATFGEKVGFIVELTYAAVASLPAEMPEPQRKQTLLVDVPTLLFPFARVIVADAVRDGGFPPVLLTPIDFAAMVRNNEQGQTNGATTGKKAAVS